jgi:hypothetical protein
VNQKLANVIKGQEGILSPYGLNTSTQETFKLNYDKSKEKFLNASFYMKNREPKDEAGALRDSREGTKSADNTKIVKRLKPQTEESVQNIEMRKGRQ